MLTVLTRGYLLDSPQNHIFVGEYPVDISCRRLLEKQDHMGVSINGGTPSSHPFYFRIFPEISHPASVGYPLETSVGVGSEKMVFGLG